MTDHTYRKKPVVIEAFQMTRERANDNTDWPQWLHEAWNLPPYLPGAVFRAWRHLPNVRDELAVQTLEGTHLVSHDDWVIRGVKGELYCCKPDIFDLTYEKA